MGIDRNNIPDEYLCEVCRPRRIDRHAARLTQLRKREEIVHADVTSDASSTSSADTDVGINTLQKKRRLQQQRQQQQQAQQQQQQQHQQQTQQQQQQQVARRKADTQPPLRQLNKTNNNNNNNNVAKRQRREQLPRQINTPAPKKETARRGPGKRKAKRRTSIDDREDETQEAWATNMAPLRQWIEKYEEAVTNHYSPELRARISSIKVNGTHSDLRQGNMNVAATGKCRLNVHSNSLRVSQFLYVRHFPQIPHILVIVGKERRFL